jgi:hypothetical protein
MTMVDLSPEPERRTVVVPGKQVREADIRHVTAQVCREAQRGGAPCYQCRDFMTRLIDACDPETHGFGLIHFIDDLLREGSEPMDRTITTTVTTL